MSYVLTPILYQSHQLGGGPGFIVTPLEISAIYYVTDMPVTAYSPYNALYSKFKLAKIEWFFVPLFQKHVFNPTLNVNSFDYSSTERGINNSIMPPLWIVNADNANLLTTLGNDIVPGSSDPFKNIRNMPQAKMFSGTKPFKWTCRPKPQMDYLRGSVSTAYAARAAWFPTLELSTQHYGTFITADTTNVVDGNPYCWMAYRRYTVYWKDPYY